MSAMDPHSIPWKELIVPQAINFGIFLGGLVYLLRKPLKEFFSNEYKKFESLRKQAEEAKVSAERHQHEIKTKLKALEQNFEKDISLAKTEAQKLKTNWIADAKQKADKLLQESEGLARFELDRAVALLKQELVESSVQMAQKEMASKIDDKGRTKMAEDFVKKIQAAQV